MFNADQRLTAQLVFKLREILEIDLPSDILFQAPTVMELAPVIDGLTSGMEEERKLFILKMLEGVIGDDVDAELTRNEYRRWS